MMRADLCFRKKPPPPACHVEHGREWRWDTQEQAGILVSLTPGQVLEQRRPHRAFRQGGEVLYLCCLGR